MHKNPRLSKATRTGSPRTVFSVIPPCQPQPPSLPRCPIPGTHLPITLAVQLWSLQRTISFISESNRYPCFCCITLKWWQNLYHTKFSLHELEDYAWKRCFLDLLLFGTRLTVFFKDMLFLTCWNLKPSGLPHNTVHSGPGAKMSFCLHVINSKSILLLSAKSASYIMLPNISQVKLLFSRLL